MTDLLLDYALLPFSIALGLLFALMGLELISALVGGSMLGLDNDADLDLDLEAEFDAPEVFELDSDGSTYIDFDVDDSVVGPAQHTDWLGISQVPALIWFASLLLGFGLIGVTLQTTALSIIGATLPVGIAVIASAFGGVWFTRKFAGVFARILPKSESTALSERHLGRRQGVVSQGTAKRGKPAEVRVIDRHGNTHHLRAEPLRDDDVIPQGSDVIVMRKSLDEGYRMVALSV